jgi:hypothetical protein
LLSTRPSRNGCSYFEIGRGSPPAVAAIPKHQKKADVAERLQALDHVGLLVNEPLGRAELLFTWSSDDVQFTRGGAAFKFTAPPPSTLIL